MRKLQKGAAGVEQVLKAVAGQELATALMAVARLLVTTEAELGDLLVQVVDDALHLRGVVGKLGSAGVDLRFQYGHGSVSLRLLLLELFIQGSVFLQDLGESGAVEAVVGFVIALRAFDLAAQWRA